MITKIKIIIYWIKGEFENKLQSLCLKNINAKDGLICLSI